jgi:glycine/D-amino acid oxidase-like deaminating enzyme
VLAAGAWAGQLGQEAGSRQPPLSAIQRHLFVSQALTDVDADQPYVWHLGEEEEFYVRPEGAAYLFSGCDETEVTPCDAQVMSGAVSAAARKLTRVAPGLAELGVARAWACLRTFAPDRRFVLGWDPVQPWLFWVAGLGGHGATAAAAVGEAAAAQIIGRLGPG